MWLSWRSRSKPKWLVTTNEQTPSTWQPSDTESVAPAKSQRRFLLLAASTATAISWSGTHFLIPPLHLISIPITLAAALPMLQDSLAAYRTRKTNVAALSSAAVIGSLLLRQTTLAALIDVVYYTGEAALAWWQKREAAPVTANSICADTNIYLVRCWQEESPDRKPVMRYVLESPNDTTRRGFTNLRDLIEALRSNLVAPQAVSTPIPASAN